VSVLVQVMFLEPETAEPCVRRVTVLEFLDAPGLPEAVTDDIGNAYTCHRESRVDVLSDKPVISPSAHWYTVLNGKMPKRITLSYGHTYDGFAVPYELPR